MGRAGARPGARERESLDSPAVGCGRTVHDSLDDLGRRYLTATGDDGHERDGREETARGIWPSGMSTAWPRP